MSFKVTRCGLRGGYIHILVVEYSQRTGSRDQSGDSNLAKHLLKMQCVKRTNLEMLQDLFIQRYVGRYTHPSFMLMGSAEGLRQCINVCIYVSSLFSLSSESREHLPLIFCQISYQKLLGRQDGKNSSK